MAENQILEKYAYRKLENFTSVFAKNIIKKILFFKPSFWRHFVDKDSEETSKFLDVLSNFSKKSFWKLHLLMYVNIFKHQFGNTIFKKFCG